MNSSQEIQLALDEQQGNTMIEVVSLENLAAGKAYIQSVKYMQDSELKEGQRVLLTPKVIIVAHDEINDKCVLIQDYKLGALQYTKEFPEGDVVAGELAYKAAHRVLLETTGLEAKSTETIHDIMVNQSESYAPVTIFYCLVDTRPLLTKCPDNIQLVGAKDLIREVRGMQHNSLGVILGSQHIRANRRRT